MKWYYYLHTNGDIIGKNPIVVDSDPLYFDSDFVKYVWLIDSENRDDAWDLVVTALAKGAQVGRVRELVSQWGLTKDDLGNYIFFVTSTGTPTNEQRYGVDLFIEKILNMDPDKYYEELILEGNKD
jgi:hypothetical protein